MGQRGWGNEAGTLKQFRGQMASHVTGEQYVATVAVDGEMIRIWNDHKRVGAWPITDVACERVTVFRFQITLDGVVHTFQPDDPGGFADRAGAIIDLRPKSRFGLGPRVKKAKEELAAARAAAETATGD